MNEYERRVEAIRRVANGESVQAVCADLERTRAWYYKCRARYRLHGLAGLQDQRPGHPPPRCTPAPVRRLIVEIRDRLVRQAEEGTYHLGIGDVPIIQELQALGIPPPHRATIYRILGQEGRIPRQESPRGYCPRPQAVQANDVHQLDLWPRVLEGGTMLFILHLVDVATWYPCGMVAGDKRTDTILTFLIQSWRHLGVPKVLQLDNEMSFTGGRWAARLGRVVRLALLLGCEVWFNPFAMPECNGHVERLHGLCDQFFWTRHHFTQVADVAQHYPAFLQAFREAHRLQRLGGQTPLEARRTLPDGRVRSLPEGVGWTPGRSLPLVPGRVHCVRRTDSQGRLSVLRQPFTLGPEYRHAYIRATVEVAEQRVTFYYQASAEEAPEVVMTKPFPLPAPIEAPDLSLIAKLLG